MKFFRDGCGKGDFFKELPSCLFSGFLYAMIDLQGPFATILFRAQGARLSLWRVKEWGSK
jgi:hypothetical protein